jgi:radical SAM protein with 4Fe4S-binding SPASM domain
MGTMSDETFYKIISDGKQMGIKYCSPFMNGEPFVFPRIWEWLDYLVKERMLFSIYTNGEYVDVDRLKRYEKNLWYLNVSINAATKETYDKVMRGPDYNEVIHNTNRLKNELRKKIYVSFVECDENAHEIGLFKTIWGKSAKVTRYSNYTGDRHCLLEKHGKKVPCYPLLHQIAILWNGDVVPCCMDYNAKMVQGNIHNDSLYDIWMGMENMRKSHQIGNLIDYPICQACNYNTTVPK